MEWSAAITLTTGGPDISFNAASGDLYYLDPEKCSIATALRVTADDAPRTAGAVLFDILKGPIRLTVSGLLIPSDESTSQRNVMAQNLEDACDAMLAADATWTHPTWGALTVRCETYVGFSGPWRKEFVLGLLAASPSWS